MEEQVDGLPPLGCCPLDNPPRYIEGNTDNHDIRRRRNINRHIRNMNRRRRQEQTETTLFKDSFLYRTKVPFLLTERTYLQSPAGQNDVIVNSYYGTLYGLLLVAFLVIVAILLIQSL